jgi:sugar phosphate isomerase/epimerase
LLNGGESNLFETWTRADVFIQSLGCDSIEFLLDSYHWLCEGWSRAEIANATTKIGYVHVVDLARHPIGTFGQATLERLSDFALLLKDLNYSGPAIAECLPMPTPEKAMKATHEWIESYFTVND